MENKKLNEIKRYLVKGASLASILALIGSGTACTPVSQTDTTTETTFSQTDFGDIVDPKAPLTSEQIVQAEKTENFIFSYNYNIRDNGIKEIIFYEPVKESENYQKICIVSNDEHSSPIEVIIDKESAAAISFLLENCKETGNSDIKNIEYGKDQYGYLNTSTITFNSLHGGNVAQKIFSIVSPFMPSMDDICVEGADLITKNEKEEMFEYLKAFDNTFNNNTIGSICLLKNLSESNPEKMYSIQIISSQFVIHTIKVSEEQYLRFNKYFKFEDIAQKPDEYIDHLGVEYESLELFLRSTSAPDILKEQVYNEIYEVLKEKDLLNLNEQELN